MALNRRGISPGPRVQRTTGFLEQLEKLLGRQLRASERESVTGAPDPEAAALGLVKLAEAVSGPAATAASVRTGDGKRSRPNPQQESSLVALLDADPRLFHRLAVLAGTSEAALDHLLRWPDSLVQLSGGPGALTADGQVVDKADLYAHLHNAVIRDGNTVTGDEAVTRLRKAYRDVVVSLMVEDLTHPEPSKLVPTVTATLSELAGAAISAADRIARAELSIPSRLQFSVIAMGKCGARELNYVSDVDVMFVFAPIETETLEADRAQAAGLANRIRSIVSEPAAEPALWDLDAALRPEGKAGPLVRTLEEFDQYYRRVAHNWEFQALFKARHIAGDDELGCAFDELANTYVWEASTREGFIPQVRAMRKRVVDLIPAKEQNRQIKLGPGGLRDVEFSCQLLQLVHGRHDPDLRVRSTLAALEALGRHSYVSPDQAQMLAEAYAFLRVIEHRLQIPRLSREALLPEKEDRLRILARAVFTSGERTVDRLRKERDFHAREVRTLHEQIFYRPVLEAAVGEAQVATLSEQAARERLAAFGYRDTKAAMKHIHALSSGVNRAAYIQKQVLPALLDWFSTGVDPDAGLLAFRLLSEKLADSTWYLKMLRDSGVAARRAAKVLSVSHFATNLLLANPQAVAWLGDSALLADPGSEWLRAQMHDVAVRHGDQAVAGIRAVYSRELLRIALADLLDFADTSEVMRRLSALMDMAIDAALLAVRKRLDAHFGSDAYEFAVIAMGRLGGAEIGYFSDADVMFVYRSGFALSPHARQALPGHVRSIALTLTKELSSPAEHLSIDIDADLRPEGKSGPLVRTLDSYANYYAAWSEPWEAQALLRARVIAGDSALGLDYYHLIDPLRYPATLGTKSVMQIRRLKARMEKERLPRGAEPKRHLKLGPGGLSDVEWSAQLLQLRHAHANPDYQTTSTQQVLAAAQKHGHLTPDDAEELLRAWLLASQIRSAAMLYRGRASDTLPTKDIEIRALAQILGYADDEAHQLVDVYLGTARRARKVMETVFYNFSD